MTNGILTAHGAEPNPAAVMDLARLRLVDTEMVAWASGLCSTSNGSEIEMVRAQLRDHFAEPLNYDRYGSAFACAFHLVNYRKAVAALSEARPHPIANIVDLGCGSGAAAAGAIAYYSAIDSRLPGLKIALIDRSRSQLALASEVVARAASAAGTAVFVERACADGGVICQSAERPTLVMAMHVLTENPEREALLLAEACNMAGQYGLVLIIERPDDPVWSAIEKYVEENSLNASSGCTTVVNATARREERREWHSRWLLIAKGPKITNSTDRSTELVRRYFNAWKNRSIDELDAIFKFDAVYADKPFQEPLRGLDEIKQYWKDNVLTQEAIKINYDNIAHTDTGVVVEWNVGFARGGAEWTVAGILVLEIDYRSMLISALREYYATKRVET